MFSLLELLTLNSLTSGIFNLSNHFKKERYKQKNINESIVNNEKYYVDYDGHIRSVDTDGMVCLKHDKNNHQVLSDEYGNIFKDFTQEEIDIKNEKDKEILIFNIESYYKYKDSGYVWFPMIKHNKRVKARVSDGLIVIVKGHDKTNVTMTDAQTGLVVYLNTYDQLYRCNFYSNLNLKIINNPYCQKENNMNYDEFVLYAKKIGAVGI